MTFSESNSAPEPTQRTVERVAEHEDEQAETQVLNDRDIQSSKERIISQFDTSTTSITELHALMPQLHIAMDELIQKTVKRLVNVRDINDLPPEKLVEIKEVVELRLEEFRKSVEQAAEKNSPTAIAMAKEKKGAWFQEHIAVARETQNDAEFKFKIEGKPDAVTMDYAEKNPNRPKVKLTVGTNEHFFASPEKTAEGTAAARIQKNKESGAYRIEGTNEKIQNPEGFKKWIQEELKALNIDPRTASPAQLTNAAIDIVKKNMAVMTDAQKAFQRLPQDLLPIDQLLQSNQEGCCRHFTVATRVVFDQIQNLAKENQNQSMEGIVTFENEMNEMGHATLALARGNEVTTIDPFWYAAGIQKTPDSTFDGRHGNFGSLYRTLSKAPEGNPGGNLFDLGSSETLVRQLHSDDGQIPEEVRELVDNSTQAILMRAREVILNTTIQTPENLIATVQSLHAATEQLDLSKPEDNLALNSIKILAPLLAEVIEIHQTEAGQKGPHYTSKINTAAWLLKVGLNARLERKKAGGPKPETHDEELIGICEAALKDQQLDQTDRLKVMKVAAEEMLYNVWQGINTALVKGRQIGQDGIYTIQITEGYQQGANAGKTLMEPTLQWVDKVLGFIKGNELKSQSDIQRNLQEKSNQLGQVQQRVKGTFAENIARAVQDKFTTT